MVYIILINLSITIKILSYLFLFFNIFLKSIIKCFHRLSKMGKGKNNPKILSLRTLIDW